MPEWDPFGSAELDDPAGAWERLRKRCPVAWSERQGGFWTVSRYEDAVEIARDAETFNNSGGPQFETARPPLEVDRPEHTFFRRVLQPYFAKERVARLEGRVRVFVSEMLEPLLDAGGGDLAETLTYPLPARTLCAWLGLDDGEWATLKGVAEELFAAEEGRGDDPETRAHCNDFLYAYSRRLVRERIERPLDPELDLISGIVGVSEGAQTVTEEDAVQLVRLLLVAGHNSTTSGLGNCLLRVAADPEIQERLRAEPELIPTAIEELLRLEVPVQGMPRWANQSVERHGRTIEAGEKVMLLWAAANRDPEAFPEPHRCILDRNPNPHLTFGRGIHRCIGIDLARLELRVALEEVIARTDLLELAGEPIRTSFIRRGVSYLPVRLRRRESDG